MTTESVLALNYTAEAIEHISFMERGLRNNAPYTSYVMRQVVDMLHNSIKFILPNCCEIIEPEEYRQAHFDLARLPYPVVTFEIPWVKKEKVPEAEGFPEQPSTKRIALCWESKAGFEPVPGCNDVLNLYPEGGVFILPISWSDTSARWVMGSGGVFYPYENEIIKTDFDRVLPASRIAMSALRDAGLIKGNAAQFRAEPFITCPDFADEMISQAGSREKLFAQIIMDTRGELQAFIQACCVLNCENVRTVSISHKPDKKFINGRRVKQAGKKPLSAYTYKILQLSDEKTASAGTDTGLKGGSRRMHLRRGHIRRRNEKLHWVRPTMVNANSAHGVVDKDYSIKVKGRLD